jgi:predicted O-methyltransferase YrrM
MKSIDSKVNDALNLTYYYSFLYNIALEMEPRLTVELGTNEGQSAYALKNGFPSGRVITIDILDNVIDRYSCNGVEFVVKDSVLAAESFEDGSVDILFIDALHDGDRPLFEFNTWLPKLSGACVVMFDDIYSNEKMEVFWVNFNPKGFVKVETRLHPTEGFGIIYRGDK